MSRNNPHIFLILTCFTGLLFLGSCGKDAPVRVNTNPLIRFLSVSSDKVVQFKDSLVITFEYKDGDGDLGETDPDKNSLQIKDSRLAKPDFYFVKPLAPPGSGISIQGTIAVKLKNTFLLGTADQETAYYEIRLKDRSGNWSNTITTPLITILKK